MCMHHTYRAVDGEHAGCLEEHIARGSGAERELAVGRAGGGGGASRHGVRHCMHEPWRGAAILASVKRKRTVSPALMFTLSGEPTGETCAWVTFSCGRLCYRIKPVDINDAARRGIGHRLGGGRGGRAHGRVVAAARAWRSRQDMHSHKTHQRRCTSRHTGMHWWRSWCHTRRPCSSDLQCPCLSTCT